MRKSWVFMAATVLAIAACDSKKSELPMSPPTSAPTSQLPVSQLPKCTGAYDAATWTNCVGEYKFPKPFPDDDKYVGEFKDGLPNGQGAMTSGDGKRQYVGEFKDGKPSGQGTSTYAEGGLQYVGEFKDGKPNGQGTETYKNVSKYVGELKDGARDGQGTSTDNEGGNYVGE